MEEERPWILVRTGHPISVIKGIQASFFLTHLREFFSYCGEIENVIQNNYDYFIQFVYYDSLVTARHFVGSEIMHQVDLITSSFLSGFIL
jgi:hypothetical protein